MINTLPSAFVFLASEKISSDSLFEGFNVDLESMANLVKSLRIITQPCGLICQRSQKE